MKRLLYSCRYKTNIAVVRRQGFGQGDEVFFFYRWKIAKSYEYTWLFQGCNDNSLLK